MSQQETATQDVQAKTLGLVRWVQMGFVAFWLLLGWVLDKIITLIWDRFAEPNTMVATFVSLAIGAGATLALYRHEKVKRVATEVVGELSKVTWPSREETQVSTVVVIITSLIAAMIIGAFDAAWSTITDLIYKG
jgi:preprotein translocase SecE subunit